MPEGPSKIHYCFLGQYFIASIWRWHSFDLSEVNQSMFCCADSGCCLWHRLATAAFQMTVRFSNPIAHWIIFFHTQILDKIAHNGRDLVLDAS